MSATRLTTSAGTARQLLTGGWLVDVGAAFPTWVPDRETARDALNVHTPAHPARFAAGAEVRG